MKEQRSYFFGSMVDEFMDKEVVSAYDSETEGSQSFAAGSPRNDSYQGDARAEIEERWLVSGSKTTSVFSALNKIDQLAPRTESNKKPEKYDYLSVTNSNEPPGTGK